MKKTSNDELRPEYDLSALKGGVNYLESCHGKDSGSKSLNKMVSGLHPVIQWFIRIMPEIAPLKKAISQQV